MKYLWVDKGNDPDYAKVQRHGINGLFFDLTDARLNKTYLNGVRYAGPGYAVGVYVAHNWPDFHSDNGARHAELVHAKLEAIAPKTGNSFPKVQFDIESVRDPQFYIDCFRRWRELRPTRDTSWTFEPWQTRPSSWISPALVDTVTDLGIRVVPQYYMGPSPSDPRDMRPVAPDMEYKRTQAKFPKAAVSGFYDAALLGDGWDGFAFTQGRLP